MQSISSLFYILYLYSHNDEMLFNCVLTYTDATVSEKLGVLILNVRMNIK